MEELRQTIYQSAQSQTRRTAIGVGLDTRRSEFMSALGRFANVSSSVLDQEVKAQIETKKALGAARAAQDLIVSEDQRRGITDDDVNATKLAYNNIVGQHDTMKAGNEFAEWYSANPDADEQTIADKKTSIYQPLFEKYGKDDNSLKQISLQVQESQFQLVPIQERIKRDYQHQKSVEAVGISIMDLMSVPSPDMDKILDEEIPARAKALGVGEFEYKKSLMERAALDAGEGDARLLGALETRDWSKGSAVLLKARRDFDNFKAREDAVVIGDAMGTIENENLSLSVPWTTTLRKIEALNKQYPDTYSPARIAAMKQARASQLKKEDLVSSGTRDSFAILSDNTRVPLQFDQKYDEATKNKIVKDLEAKWAEKNQELVGAGMSPDDANKLVMKSKLDWSRVNRRPLPSFQAAISSMLNLNLDEITREGMPPYAADGMNVLKAMDNTSLDMYLGSESDKTFALNFKQFSTQMSDDQAYRRAAAIKDSPYKVTPTQRTQQAEAVRARVSDRLENTIWETFSTKDLQQSVPDWQKEQLISSWTADAEQRMYAGGFDVGQNADYVIDNKLARSSQMFNGTLVNQPLANLYHNIKGDREMSADKTMDYVEAFLRSSKYALDKEYGADVNLDEVTLNFGRDGKTFTIVDKNGDQIGARFFTEDIYPVGRAADLGKLRDITSLSKEAQQAREVEFKQAIESDISRGLVPAIPFI